MPENTDSRVSERGEHLDAFEGESADWAEDTGSSERTELLAQFTQDVQQRTDGESQGGEAPETREALTLDQLDRLRETTQLGKGEWPERASNTPELSERELTERKRCAQELETRLAEIQGRPPSRLRFDDELAQPLPWNENGHFNPATKEIMINVNRLREESPQRLINVVAHEGRHAYQTHAIEVDASIHHDQREVAAWRANDTNYITYDPAQGNYEDYYNQPLEADAFSYGDFVADQLMKSSRSTENDGA
jgi:hypothetical protein